MSDDHIDTDALVRLALEQAAEPRSDGGSEWLDFVGSTQALVWIEVLAIPRIFRGLGRIPPPEHLINMVDIFLAYIRRGKPDTEPTFHPVPYERREPSALRLRALLEAWTPPELSQEITEAARELLYAEGLNPPEGWDQLPDPEPPIAQKLWWPEDVPAPLRAVPPPAPRSPST
jgi:hypothetical protein